MNGICGTCAQPALATRENEGYSDCCNDRIEYGEEAVETVRRANCPHTNTKPYGEGTNWLTCITCEESFLESDRGKQMLAMDSNKAAEQGR
jgi:hypothetical protein